MAASEISIANLTNFEKIQNVFNDEKAYKEILENSETFNTRLCIERRLRMPFLDPQTGVAQNHSSLFFSSKQRLPGFREGQIYTYPSKRWQKPKRQYLLHRESYKAYQYREKTYLQHHFNSAETVSVNTASNDSTSMGASADNDSKDSHGAPEKEWFYEDMESHVDDFEEDFESDMDFDESYSKKKRRGRVPKKAPADRGETTPKRGRGGGRGRRKMAVQAIENDRRRSTTNSSSAPATATPSSSTNVGSPLNTTEEHPPMSSTPPGVMDPPSTHHLPPPPLPPPHVQPPTHFQHYQFPLHHSQPPQIPPSFPMPNPFNSSSSTPSGSNVPPEDQASSPPSTTSAATASTSAGSSTSTTTSASTSSPTKSTMSTLNHAKIRTNEQRDKADPSPYCDFCLGDAKENRKTNVPEELVSCADCGRSGHPTCLQFTPNMIISVKRYRWQCIECKYCSICGTSDNDDQLLFCDDCDRGYHMYCLSPPLTTPPEGSWSCKLCLEEFHTPKK